MDYVVVFVGGLIAGWLSLTLLLFWPSRGPLIPDEYEQIGGGYWRHKKSGNVVRDPTKTS